GASGGYLAHSTCNGLDKDRQDNKPFLTDDYSMDATINGSQSIDLNSGIGGWTLANDLNKDTANNAGNVRFRHKANSQTNCLMLDRAKADGGAKDVSSIAAVGFGLTALCIGEQRGWVDHQQAYDRSMKVLRFLRDKAPQEHGHFYHFLDMRTGKRVWECEVSN